MHGGPHRRNRRRQGTDASEHAATEPADPADVETEYALGLEFITAGIDPLFARRGNAAAANGTARAAADE
ncbi:hypothetical protein [Citricoccus sp.]|uniref:hypothetical protein n=1 Tax=Citricoccus sp. TaxID=1978372 RepID=UPI0028BD38A5|nr:hypothetical protein [Citricoccus sp.]